jgi:hypothetical protein
VCPAYRLAPDFELPFPLSFNSLPFSIMKTFLLSRLSLLLLLFGLSATLATAQTRTYTEASDQPDGGYWTIETDQTQRNYSVVRFYTAQHEKIYEERLDELCLDPSKGTAKCRRTARRLNAALAQAQQARSNSMVASNLGLHRRIQRAYALR